MNKMNIELNVSCPNLDKKMINEGLSSFLNDNRKWCIIKLSPIALMYSYIINYTIS